MTDAAPSGVWTEYISTPVGFTIPLRAGEEVTCREDPNEEIVTVVSVNGWDVTVLREGEHYVVDLRTLYRVEGVKSGQYGRAARDAVVTSEGPNSA